nr:hypothetical protein [uncultured Alistipes sp.]
MDLSKYHSKSQALILTSKKTALQGRLSLPTTPDSDYRKEVDMPFPTFAEYPILCNRNRRSYKIVPTSRFCGKSPLHPSAEAYFPQKSCRELIPNL